MLHLSLRKLNLGCGDDHREGYLNVDLQAFHHPDVVADVLDLRDFPSGWFEEILALGLIEHFKRADTRRALYEWNRLLAPGGRLQLSTTYVYGLVRKLEAPALQSIEGHELIIETLFAGQHAEGDYHLTAFSELLLRYYLWECGFDIEDIRLRDDWLFEATARKARDCSFVELLNESGDIVFLWRAYWEILQRDPDPAGLARYREALGRQTMTREEVIKELLLGHERKKLMVSRAPPFPRVFDPCIAPARGEAPARSKAPFLSMARRIAQHMRPGSTVRQLLL